MSKVDLTPMKLACLKDAAESINPAHRSWYLNDYKRWVETYENGDAIIVCHPEQIQPALSFIAEADPATVLAMVEEIEFLRRDNMVKAELLGKAMLKAKESEAGQRVTHQSRISVPSSPNLTGSSPNLGENRDGNKMAKNTETKARPKTKFKTWMENVINAVTRLLK